MKNILFITGTRADFGKLKPLIKVVHEDTNFNYAIFGTGMHLMSKYGNTISEIRKSGFNTPFTFMNQVEGESLEMILANTVQGLSRYLHEHQVDLIVVHGDRIEALAGAIAGALRNVLVAHVEGGEISGTIDELLRHATSKLSHIHFVASNLAKKRLMQLGESKNTIFRIGSPDVDVMLSGLLPSLEEVRERYKIDYPEYAIAILHPVTSEKKIQKGNSTIFVDSIIASNKNYIIIYPNNDLGSEDIFETYKRFENYEKVKVFPSIRFEFFLTLLRNCQFIIGNSSAGIHEAPVYGVPTINIGTRQKNRFDYLSISNVSFDQDEIFQAIDHAIKVKSFPPCDHYGDGSSAEKFISTIKKEELWAISTQKQFKDL